MKPNSWKNLILDVVSEMPHQFTLSDVERYKDDFSRFYPDNRFIEAKIRQTLQVLRDQGAIEFLGRGRYRRLNVAPAFSLMFDPTLARAYRSRAQVARTLIETWAEMNLYCVNCTADALERLPPNTPVADFVCGRCNDRYQLKAKSGWFSDMVIGAAYDPLLAAAKSGAMPEHLLIEFNSRISMICRVRAIPGERITADRIIARRALGPRARRAGWVGCSINIAGLPAVNIVSPRADDRQEARALWSALR